MELPSNERSDKLIYMQLADWLEDGILSGAFPEGGQIPSVAELSAGFKINHVTALKGISLLTDGDIIYKKRGIGMFVSEGAQEKIRAKRREEYCKSYICTAAAEARKLGIPLEDAVKMLEKEYNNEQA